MSAQIFDTIRTPALLLDRDRLSANIDTMITRADGFGARWRPHMKTAKSLPIQAMLNGRGIAQYAVSTHAEAAGLSVGAPQADYMLAVPLIPAKVRDIAPLIAGGFRLSALIDSMEAARDCAEAARAQNIALPFWIEIDVDHARNGCDVEGGELVAITQFLMTHDNASVSGVVSYAGSAYSLDDQSETTALAARHVDALRRARLLVEGITATRIPLSFGGTPAVCSAADLRGIDELRCGINMFGDMMQVGLKTCNFTDLVLSVLTSVVARSGNRAFVDAGFLALSKDRSTANRPFDIGYGRVADLNGVPIGDAIIGNPGQELGPIVSPTGMLDLAEFPLGRQLRIFPNHADATAAAHQRYVVIDRDGHLVDTWDRISYW